MANRSTLHINKLDAFKEWLDSQGLGYRPGKGPYQVLQVQTRDYGFQCIFKKNDMPEHYSINDKLYPLVREFLRSTKETFKPDKDKIIDYANDIMMLIWPAVESQEALNILEWAKQELLNLTNEIIKKTDNL